jgi:hypothetical protein
VIYSDWPTRNRPNIYKPVRWCIYCGEKNPPFQKEHIIALGLDGGFILPESSCPKCAKITGGVEQDCLRRFFGLHREKIGIKSNRHKKDKQRFGLRKQSGGSRIEMDPKHLPNFLVMPLFARPAVLIHGQLVNIPLVIKDHRSFIFSKGSSSLINLYGPFAVDQPYDLILLARMLSKIAHSLAIADLGAENFIPYLPPIILGDDLSYIGSVVGQMTESSALIKAKGLHSINISCHTGPTANPLWGEWVIVHIKLFQQFVDVIYSVVVGKLKPTPTYLKWKGLLGFPPDQLGALRRHYDILPFHPHLNSPTPP